MKKIFSALIIGILVMAQAGFVYASFDIAGYTFDDNAGVDQVITSVGTYENNYTPGMTLSAAQLSSVLTDNSVITYAYSRSTPAYVQLEFTNNYAVNGPGYDLAIFDLGTDALFPMSLTVGGTIITYATSYTGHNTAGLDGPWKINVALVDLSDFGVSSLSSIFVLAMDSTAGGLATPTLGFAGALHSASAVPEPATMLLLGLGLVGLTGLRRK